MTLLGLAKLVATCVGCEHIGVTGVRGNRVRVVGVETDSTRILLAVLATSLMDVSDFADNKTKRRGYYAEGLNNVPS